MMQHDAFQLLQLLFRLIVSLVDHALLGLRVRQIKVDRFLQVLD